MDQDDKKVIAMPGARISSSKPDSQVIKVLEDLLAHAKSGRLQSFIATGFLSDGTRISAWADTHPNYFEMLGSIEALKEEFLERRSCEF